MGLRREIKGNARRALTGRFGPSIITLFVVALVMGLFGLLESAMYEVFSMGGVEDLVLYERSFGALTITVSLLSLIATGISALFGFVVMVPLGIGVIGWHLGLVSGEASGIMVIFRFFSSARSLWKTWSLTFNLLIRAVIWHLAFCLPGVIILLLSGNLFRTQTDPLDSATSIFGTALGVSLVLVLLLVASVNCTRYLLAPFLLAENPASSVRSCIRRSVAAMKGYHGHAFQFLLSFLPWALVSVAVLSLLYVLPYVICCLAMYAKYLLEREARMSAREA